jgi:hypothetical protein
MSEKGSDPAQNPVTPQFQLGATSDEAYNQVQIMRLNLPEPGDIVARMGQQFQLPRADTDSQTGQNRGTPYG